MITALEAKHIHSSSWGVVEGVQKVFALAKKLAINKKSTVVVQS